MKTWLAAIIVAAALTSPAAAQQQGWTFQEDKSKVDDSTTVIASLFGQSGQSALGIRCFEKRTAVVVFFDKILGVVPLKVIYRINDSNAVTVRWNVSRDGKLALAPNPIGFARSLPENGKLFLRVVRQNGQLIEDTFTLGNITEARNRVAAACKWPAAR